MPDMKIIALTDDDLIDQLLREGGSTPKFSPQLDALKAEMKRRLDKRHRCNVPVGWGVGIPTHSPEPS